MLNLEQILTKHCLSVPLAHAVRPNGLFWQNFDAEWRPQEVSAWSCVHQSRLLYTSAVAYELGLTDSSVLIQSLRALREWFWDKENGGFFWAVQSNGFADHPLHSSKHLYAQSFALFAASRVERVLPNHGALELAEDTWQFILRHLLPEETQIQSVGFDLVGIAGEGICFQLDQLGEPTNHRSSNTLVHVIEALNEFISVKRDSLAINVLTQLVSTAEAVSPLGKLALGWRVENGLTVLSDQAFSPGHALELAHLLKKSANILQDDHAAEVGQTIARYTINNGWSSTNAMWQFYVSDEPNWQRKGLEWWVSCEAALGIEIFPDLRELNREILSRTYEIIRAHIDTEAGGFFPNIDNRIAPMKSGVKASAWVDPYHQTRCIFELLKLRDLMRTQ